MKYQENNLASILNNFLSSASNTDRKTRQADEQISTINCYKSQNKSETASGRQTKSMDDLQ